MLAALLILRRRWRPVVALAALGVAVASVLTLQMPTSYRATAQLFASPAPAATGDSAAALSEASYFTAERVQSYPGLVTSPRVLGPVIADLGLETTPADLAERVAAHVPPATVIVEVKADAATAEQSAALANAVARNLADVAQQLDTVGPDGAPAVRLQVAHEAAAPVEPRSPVPAINLAGGLAAGLALGLGLALARDSLDSTVRDRADVEAAGLPVLAEVPRTPTADQPRLGRPDPATPAAWTEGFRRVRMALDHLPTDGPPRTVLVTSVTPGAGSTTAAANLAAALAEAGHRTVLVDADLRRPGVATLLGLVPDSGVTSALAGAAAVDELPQAGPGFDAVAAGPRPPNPGELLGSHAFADLVARLRAQYDSVVVDAPALLPSADAAAAAGVADAVVVVCRQRRTRLVDLHAAVASLRRGEARVAGAVVTWASGSGPTARPRARWRAAART